MKTLVDAIAAGAIAMIDQGAISAEVAARVTYKTIKALGLPLEDTYVAMSSQVLLHYVETGDITPNQLKEIEENLQ